MADKPQFWPDPPRNELREYRHRNALVNALQQRAQPEVRSYLPPWYDRFTNYLTDQIYGPQANAQQRSWVNKFTGPENPVNVFAQASEGVGNALQGYRQGNALAAALGGAQVIASNPFWPGPKGATVFGKVKSRIPVEKARALRDALEQEIPGSIVHGQSSLTGVSASAGPMGKSAYVHTKWGDIRISDHYANSDFRPGQINDLSADSELDLDEFVKEFKLRRKRAAEQRKQKEVEQQAAAKAGLKKQKLEKARRQEREAYVSNWLKERNIDLNDLPVNDRRPVRRQAIADGVSSGAIPKWEN